MKNFMLDPKELSDWISERPVDAEINMEAAILEALPGDDREILCRAATLRSLGPETWRRLGGTDESFQGLCRSPIVSLGAGERIMVASRLALGLEEEGRPVEALVHIEGESTTTEPPVQRVRLLGALGREDEGLELADAWMSSHGEVPGNESAWLLVAEAIAASGTVPWSAIRDALRTEQGVQLPDDPAIVRMHVALCDLDGARRALVGAAKTPATVALVARLALFTGQPERRYRL